ncbi:MAG TPA: FAD-dependent oxidoreductase, partial [Acidimicrobiales bacterium]|nr:FAD-dependent oxidoreductase [Acidimicrobiales bacterium]
EVRVVDRGSPGAGASWQNAGYVAPSICVPLPEPSILRYGLRATFRPRSPVGVVHAWDPALLRFMATMVRYCTTTAWARSMDAFRALNERVVDSYRRLLDAGVHLELREADFLACFAEAGESAGFRHELEQVAASGQVVDVRVLTGSEARETEPLLSERVAVAVAVRGQRYLTPSAFVAALARSVRDRGGTIMEGVTVDAVERRRGAVVARGSQGELDADAIVLATGAWASRLLAGHGVRVPIYGGRGYSFTVAADRPVSELLYLPTARVAVTPRGDRAQVSGIMEFGSPDVAMRTARFAHMVRAARPMVGGLDWSRRADEWMGPRPLSADGVPLVGATRTPGLYVAGGHGMWGVTLGPLTGSLLATTIATGVAPAELVPLDPCR